MVTRSKVDYTSIMRSSILLLLLLTLLLGACNLLPEEGETPTATETVPIPTPADTPVLESTPTTPEPIAPVQTTITLTVWTTPDIAPRTELPGGTALVEQFNAYDQSHPDVNLFIELKTVSDQGGALSYLHTGRSVAPSVLPDIVLLPTSHLTSAAAEQLIYPVDGMLPTEMISDLYPAAREMVTTNERVVGYPFALSSLKHLVYDRNVITGTLPSTWGELTTRGADNTFIYPAAGPAGAELTLQLYLAAGGSLSTEGGQPLLQVEPLTTALTQLNQAAAANFIDPQSGSTATLEQAWQAYLGGTPNLVETSASVYLRQRAEGTTGDFAFAPLPGSNGPLTPLVTGWAWTVATADPVRQALAAELIQWLASPQNLGEWSRQSRMLPARPSAFDAWPEGDAYVLFVQRQLEAARPVPADTNSVLLQALSKATADVILQLNTPEAAAQEAATAVSSP